MSINHNYSKGPKFQRAEILIDGSNGSVFIKFGLLLNYPKGEPDEVWLKTNSMSSWKKIEFEGSWFPDAFIGIMNNFQRYISGEDKILYTSIDDSIQTMALVEACYISSQSGFTKIPK